MLDPSTQLLIRKLVELTEANRLAWKEGEGRRCLLDSEGYVVEIAGDPAELRLLQDGRELDRVVAADLASVRYGDGEDTFATKVSDMARRAGRVARGAETAISRILSSLSAPPMKPADPEPEPAAIAFGPALTPAMEVEPRIESAAAIAAVTADLASVRQYAAEHAPTPPPAPHSAPEPPPVEPAPPATDTSLARMVLAAESVSPALSASAPETESRADSRVAEAMPQSFAPAPGDPVTAAAKPPAPSAAAATTRPAFGAVASFAKAAPPQSHPAPETGASAVTDRAHPTVAASAPRSTALFMSGFSARSVQKPDSATAADLARVAPQPPPPPTPRIEPRGAAPAGADIYKPWS